MKDYYKEYGNCYLIKKRKDRYINMIDVINISSQSKYKTIIGQSTNYLYVLIINTFNRPAYDLYYDLKGDHIYKLDGFSTGAIIEMLEDIKTLENNLI